MPKITKFIEGLTDISEMGTSFKAGIPNLSGNVPNIAMRISNDSGFTPTGVFKNSSDAGQSNADGSGSNAVTINFNAQNINSVYNDSTTVQPQSTKYPYYIVVANGYVSDVSIDYNNVASKDLANVTYPVPTLGQHTYGSGDRIIERYVSSDGLTWYEIYASGWKRCGGIASTTAVASSHTIQLPLTFSSVNYTIVLGQKGAPDTATYATGITARTASSFTYRGLYSANSAGNQVDYSACGY